MKFACARKRERAVLRAALPPPENLPEGWEDVTDEVRRRHGAAMVPGTRSYQHAARALGTTITAMRATHPQKGARTFCVLTIQKGQVPGGPKPEAFAAGDVKAAIAAFHQHLGRRVHVLEQGPETDPGGWPSYQLSYDVTDPPSAELPQ